MGNWSARAEASRLSKLNLIKLHIDQCVCVGRCVLGQGSWFCAGFMNASGQDSAFEPEAR